MSSHTPGPWRQHSEHPDRIIVNGSCVYQVRDMTTDDGFAGNGFGQPNPKDVRVMAASPELLAACCAVLDYFNETRSGREWRDNGGNEPSLLAAAIAKATQEERGE